MKSFLLAAVLGIVYAPASAVQLKDLYSIDPVHRAWYVGGVYDHYLATASQQPGRLECIEKLGLEGTMRALSEFVTALPANPASRERRAYDNMPAAVVIGLLILDQKCPGRVRQPER